MNTKRKKVWYKGRLLFRRSASKKAGTGDQESSKQETEEVRTMDQTYFLIVRRGDDTHYEFSGTKQEMVKKFKEIKAGLKNSVFEVLCNYARADYVGIEDENGYEVKGWHVK